MPNASARGGATHLGTPHRSTPCRRLRLPSLPGTVGASGASVRRTRRVIRYREFSAVLRCGVLITDRWAPASASIASPSRPLPPKNVHHHHTASRVRWHRRELMYIHPYTHILIGRQAGRLAGWLGSAHGKPRFAFGVGPTPRSACPSCYDLTGHRSDYVVVALQTTYIVGARMLHSVGRSVGSLVWFAGGCAPPERART